MSVTDRAAAIAARRQRQQDDDDALAMIREARLDGVTARQLGHRFDWDLRRRGSVLLRLEAAGLIYARSGRRRERLYIAWPDAE